MAAYTRATFAAALAADASLAAFRHYAEPPAQLAGGASMVVAPRSPYWTFGTYGSVDWHLAVSILVPMSRPTPMDLIDAGLALLWAALVDLDGVDIGQLGQVGIMDDVGASRYVVATIDVDLT